MSELEQEIALTLKREPWLTAEEWTFWRATGTYAAGGSFKDCLMVRLPDFATGGAVIFQMLPPLSDVITPDRIAAAREYELKEVER